MKLLTPTRRAPAGSFSSLHLLAAVCLFLLAFPARLWAADPTGHLYGEVTTTSGTIYRGVLRWGNQEAFWDDLFNSGKTEMPYLEEFDKKRRRSNIEILGRAFGVRFSRSDRQFVTRFGYIDRIEVLGHAKARLTMKDGTEVEVAGSADDVEATIQVADASVGDVKVPWKKVQQVQFLPTPADAVVEGFRLRGTVRTTDRELVGYIQWDSEECLSFDELDGDEDDVRLSIEMGKIRSISRHDRRSAEVVLWDGRRMVLDGTNDVNDDIRGILVEDERFGRVKVPWDEFRSLELEAAGASGRAYDEFGPGRALRGAVIDRDGGRHLGHLVFDLDEAFGWEMLDGEAEDISYSIPFETIASIEPRGSRSATVRLRNGEELRLEDTQDVSSKNDGVAVLPEEGDPSYVEWEEIERIELE